MNPGDPLPNKTLTPMIPGVALVESLGLGHNRGQAEEAEAWENEGILYVSRAVLTHDKA